MEQSLHEPEEAVLRSWQVDAAPRSPRRGLFDVVQRVTETLGDGSMTGGTTTGGAMT